MRRIVIAALFVVSAILAGCGTDMPSVPDGGAKVTVTIADTSGLLPGGTPGVPLYLDSADPTVWERWLPSGLFHGVTTNPLLLERAGQTCTVAPAASSALYHLLCVDCLSILRFSQ